MILPHYLYLKFNTLKGNVPFFQAWHALRCGEILQQKQHGLSIKGEQIAGRLLVNGFSANDGQSWVRDVLSWLLKEGGMYTPKKGSPYFAFTNMPAGNGITSIWFTLKKYCEKTGVPPTTARIGFDVLEKLDLVQIDRSEKQWKICRNDAFVVGNLTRIAMKLLRYKTIHDIGSVKANIQEVIRKSARLKSNSAALEIRRSLIHSPEKKSH